MTAIQKMYRILTEMLAGAEQDKPEEVSRLNREFEMLEPEVYHEPPTESDWLYNNCRQSCIMAGQMRFMREDFLRDARERFSKIPVV